MLVQPTSGARTMPNTASESAAVTENAPARSSVPGRRPMAGRTRRLAMSTRMPTGMLMKKTQRQSSAEVSRPPRKTPAVPPAGAAAP